MVALITVSLVTAAPARADVMAVSDGQTEWVAGGPTLPKRPVIRRAMPRAGAAVPAVWHDTIATLADRYDLAPAVIEALVWQESRWHTGAVSPKGARGLAQLMPQTARALGADPDNPVENVTAGARYLRGLLDRFHGNLELALAAYDAGPARVARAGKVPPISETRAYIAAILARLAAETTDRR
jgi:soluble lytic murein transglycosylase-like protein